jgi:FixJ family two-component response regulator
MIIAIVDDDPGMRGSLDSLLRSAGLASLAFASAEELIGSDARARIRCVVTDLHMPGMTGLELQAELARRCWDQPVILMTAYPTESSRDQALGAGAVAFLTKPIDPDQLLEAIDAATR